MRKPQALQQAQLRGEHVPKGDGCSHLAQEAKKAQVCMDGLSCGRGLRAKRRALAYFVH